MYDRQRNVFHHYDSFKSHNVSSAKSLAKKVEPFLTGKLSRCIRCETF